jgi:hypothetical protein
VRAYMLLDIVDKSCEYAVQALRSGAKVILADRLEGYPNVIVAVEAADRQSLAEAIMPLLGCIDGVTENLNLLVSRDNDVPPEFLASRESVTCERGGERVNCRKNDQPRKGDDRYA